LGENHPASAGDPPSTTAGGGTPTPAPAAADAPAAGGSDGTAALAAIMKQCLADQAAAQAQCLAVQAAAQAARDRELELKMTHLTAVAAQAITAANEAAAGLAAQHAAAQAPTTPEHISPAPDPDVEMSAAPTDAEHETQSEQSSDAPQTSQPRLVPAEAGTPRTHRRLTRHRRPDALAGQPEIRIRRTRDSEALD